MKGDFPHSGGNRLFSQWRKAPEKDKLYIIPQKSRKEIRTLKGKPFQRMEPVGVPFIAVLNVRRAAKAP